MGHIRAVLLNKWFLLNYLVSLLVTLPIPMLHVKVNGEVAARFSVYACYVHLVQGRFSHWTLIAIALHLGVCFLVTLVVWLIVARTRRKPGAQPEQQGAAGE